MYAEDSINLLTQAHIDFSKHQRCGISIINFAEEVTHSGLFLNDDVVWISFHSGFDFG